MTHEYRETLHLFSSTGLRRSKHELQLSRKIIRITREQRAPKFDVFTAFGKYTLALRQSPEPSPPRTPV